MKFGKELASQMVQEWQTAYMDYDNLKSLLKDVMIFRQEHALTSSSPSGPEARSRALKRRLTMYRAFSGLTRGTTVKTEDEVILVSSDGGAAAETHYQTMFLKSSEEGGEYEMVFFRRLDEEFNKVVKFYKEKVQEVKMEAQELNRQMDALIALRIKVDKPYMRNKKNKNDINSFRPAPLEILDHVKINVEPNTPVSTLKNVLGSSKSDLSFSKDELKRAEEKMIKVFVEFCQQLRLLKSYCFLNMLAFSKIMKKYDKITTRSASKSYLEMVDKSYLGTCDEVSKLIERTEATFIKHFANGNRRKGMKSLKPGHKVERHRTTFFLGLFTGCSIALAVAIIISIHARDLLNHERRGEYMESIFTLYSFVGFIVLHMVMYGMNTYYWRQYRVNYPFIFGFKPGTELGFREVLLVASGLSVLTLAAVLSNLDMEMDRRTERFQTLTELVPLALVLVVLSITFCPFNIIYRSSRYFLLSCAWHCLCAPLYKVTLSDFFLADQLTSQVQAFRSIQFYVYYYALGDFRKRSNKFLGTSVYDLLYIVVAIIPYWSRVLQCLRRLFEERDPMQGFNALKYLSTIAALVMRTMYSLNLRKPMFWRIMAASTSGFTTVYNTYWDIVIDWGLLRKNSKNPWLRDKLLISNKAVYFVAIVVNILLRLVWMQLVLDFNETRFLHRKAMVTLVACLEIIRRGIWNFFRLENEHFNNVGKYRAFKSVPLPFHYEDEKIR
ncbi:hypothetical protein MIMGU_mgv1a002044mg [Erythranthe guttata]|uniref:SPX domain-containing protein n=1 Tax=Erythranthe guttata TaxID=4155 RepID=A0A022RWK9_ERYGU|nr:hypothetical protein MIMGU_mgv1a002044mg [Erythranthe guttata]